MWAFFLLVHAKNLWTSNNIILGDDLQKKTDHKGNTPRANNSKIRV